MKKILIALDYEDTSLKVAEMGHRIAVAMNAQTILMHVVPEASYFSSPKYSPIIGYDNFNGLDMIETDSASEALKIARKFLEQSKSFLGDDSIQTIVHMGDYTENILAAATELEADLIVMGTHNRSGIEKIFAGSVAEKVLHQSTVPVLIIPVKNA